MAKRQPKNYNVDLMQPDELNALKKEVGEFLKRLQNVDNEISSLKEARKELLEEFSTKLDMKTLQAALRVVNIEQGVAHKDTYDMFIEVLKDDVTNGHVDS